MRYRAHNGEWHIIEEVVKHVSDQLARHEFDFVAARYFEQLDHDNQHRIFKFFRWELPKSNGSYAGYVDYSKLAAPKLEGMTAATLGKFLIVCALASELYCPAYVSSPALSKDSQLAKQAAHYRINTERILRELKEQGAIKSALNLALERGRKHCPVNSWTLQLEESTSCVRA